MRANMRNSVVSLLLCAGFTCPSGLSKALNSSMNEGYMSRKAVSNCSKKVAESLSDKREEEVMLSKSFICPTLIFRRTNNSNLLSRSMNLAHRSIYSFANRSRCLLVSFGLSQTLPFTSTRCCRKIVRYDACAATCFVVSRSRKARA